MIKPLIGTERPRIWKYIYCAGPSRSRFLLGLKEKKILGVHCPTCNKVYVPARGTCYRCGADLDEWVEVSHEGTLLSYSIMHANSVAYIKKAPFVYGLVKLEGADTALLHFVDAPRICVALWCPTMVRFHTHSAPGCTRDHDASS